MKGSSVGYCDFFKGVRRFIVVVLKRVPDFDIRMSDDDDFFMKFYNGWFVCFGFDCRIVLSLLLVLNF